ncbi:pentapeptide repeat-containing protein [Halomicronema sp. CCY15110]|uniref:pentapeptide repeat-containing protein n=1 Tax=Halomicronema sp. CCY15110 TaxID=2767773 RepID=UPI00194FADA0|nr:pentapeptide repeat-containing protein [Halomicronema sp. CCY15110]
MRERFKRWQPQQRSHSRWVIGAIATSVFLGIGWSLWSLTGHQGQSDRARPDQNDSTILTPLEHSIPLSDIGAIAAVLGGLSLLFKYRIVDQDAAIVDLSGANFSEVDLNGTDLSGANLSGANFSGAALCGANLSGANLNGADLNGADLSGANLSGANLNGADLIRANLNSTNLSNASLRYANLSEANFRYANLSGADFRQANLSGADLNCTLLSRANFSEANLSSALLFFINLRDVLNLEPFQLAAQPSPLLCHVALPTFGQQPDVNPNRACDRIPQLLSTRYRISLEEAQWIVNEARQHPWD